MKRPIIVVVAILAFVLLLTFGGYAFLSHTTEAGIRSYFAGDHPFEGAQMELSSYEKGLFKSRATSSIAIAPGEEAIRLVNEIYHGPAAFTPNGLKIGSAHVVTTLDINSLPEEIRENVAEIFAGKDPLVITTDVSFTGGRTSAVTIASIDHEKDGMEIRFDGGDGRWEASADNSLMVGNLTIQPLSMRMNEEEGGIRLRMDQSTFQMKNTDGAVAVEGNVGGMKLAIKDEGDQSVEMGGLLIRSSFSPAAPESKVMLGSGKFSAPLLKVEWTGEGEEKSNAEMKGLSIEMRSSETNGLVTSTADYLVESLAVSSPSIGSPAPYLDELGKGMQFTAKATLPREILEDFGAFQETMRSATVQDSDSAASELAEEQAREMARLLEKSVRKIGAGTGFEMLLRAGSADGGSKASFSYTYQGARPLTSQKTYIEVIENSELQLEASVPKAFFDASPEIAEQVQGMLAMGAIKDSGAVYASTLALRAGQLTANGEPFPLLENFLPLLSQEIPWDTFFAGLEAGAAARAELEQEDAGASGDGNQ
ncbi:MAG: DUF945 family protein [Verrucomicrobiales bacterium]|nr:DUF945 family protein [Verrucomicrobiales bacterium]